MRNCISALACWLFILPVLPLAAQSNQTYDLAKLEEGSIFEYETSEGYLARYTRGQLGENYFFRITKQLESGRVVLIETGVNKAGGLVWQRFAGTAIGTENFSPHDCSFVIDTCEYEVFERGVLTATVNVTTEYTDEMWKRKDGVLNTDGHILTRTQCGIFDQNSIVIALFSFSSDGSRYWQKTTSGPFADMADSMLDRVTSTCGLQMIIS